MSTTVKTPLIVTNRFAYNSQEREQMLEMDYEQCLSVGMQAREMHDVSRWVFGDLAFLVKAQWGEDALLAFAKDTGLEKTTLLRYREVARKITPELREQFRHLSWSHFKIAAGQDNPKEILEFADERGLTVESMAMESRRRKGNEKPAKPKLYQCADCGKWCHVGGERCEFNGQHPQN